MTAWIWPKRCNLNTEKKTCGEWLQLNWGVNIVLGPVFCLGPFYYSPPLVLSASRVHRTHIRMIPLFCFLAPANKSDKLVTPAKAVRFLSTLR